MQPRTRGGPSRGGPARAERGGERGGRGGGRGSGGGRGGDRGGWRGGDSRGGRGRGRGEGGRGRGRGEFGTAYPPREGPALVGRGPSADQGILQSGSTVSNIAGHVRAVGIKRPGYGSAGTRTVAIVNALEMTFQDMNIYHYDANMLFIIQVATKDKNYPQRLNVQLLKTLQHDTAAQIFHPAGAYDGKKNLFMSHKLDLGPSDSGEFDVVLAQPGQNPDKSPPVYKIKVTLVRVVNTALLHGFIQGTQTQDENVLTALTALNVIIRADPIMSHPFNTRSFFPLDGERRPVGLGFELVRGYFQSVRPAIGKLLVNVDISTGLFIKSGSLIDVALDFLNPRDPDVSCLLPENLGPRGRALLQRFLSGVRVLVVPSKRAVTISRLSQVAAKDFVFTLGEGEKITVTEYYRRQNEQVRYPGLLCIHNSKGAAFPFEKCTVIPGQLARKQIPSELTKEMVNFSRKRPAERMHSIRQGVSLLAYGQSEYIRNFRLSVNSGPFPSVEARVITPPTLQYGEGSKQTTVTPAFGSWNMIDKKFVKPKDIRSWAVLVYESERRMGREPMKGVIDGFMKACRAVGATVHVSPVVRWENGQGNTEKQMKDIVRDCKNKLKSTPDLILVILPDHGNDIYRKVKQCAYLSSSLVSITEQLFLCINDDSVTVIVYSVSQRNVSSHSTVMAQDRNFGPNVCLKTNAKLGGVNVVPTPSSASVLVDPHNPTVIMGGDIIHPPPGGAPSTPSFTAVVGNVDADVAKYIATSRVQEGRLEIIKDLYGMSKEILQQYRTYREKEENLGANSHRSAPKRIIFFRDGVSEGEFAKVRDQELAVLKRVCKDLGIDPKITFIIVGKRHHYRFQPANDRTADRSGNLPAGTVIDQGITHPVEFDFYLQSHAGIIGTSRSAHYTVLYDENEFNADALQSLCYTLCHVYARCTRSVSIPAPVYYADIVCSRARNHFDPSIGDFSDTATDDSRGSRGRDLESYEKAYKQVAGSIAQTMYFM
ncbi:hypothetical protein D9758_005608 [Tetrapyrgos nigripes]|uniref:Argonaute-like protein n=1 Tax=Tetrapyrgos nigripes TaxID=182062 RepID=A0A8H5GH55_9AGAR|nr:hypothetical protein D9758_005608 [Tetrapyrgos nigripes]